MSQPDFIDRRLKDQFLAAGNGARGAGECPSSEAIFAACRGELPTDRTAALLDHALDCAHCTEALALAREVVSRMDEIGSKPVARNWTWVGLAAAVLLVAIVVLPRLLDTGEAAPADEFRTGGTTFELTTPLAAGTVLPRDTFVLRWDPAAEGSFYTIEVVTVDLSVVDRAEDLPVAEYRVPAARLAGFETGAELLWRVDVAAPDGARGESPAFRVVLGD